MIRSLSVAYAAFLLSILITGCGAETRAEPTPSEAPSILTTTLQATFTPQASETSLPPPPQPTAAPVEGITSTQVNVRAEPSTASQVLGMIPANTNVEITGKDPGEAWWQINYPQGVEGKGWVTAQYITTASTPEVPVVANDGADPNNGNVAVVQQQLNVRSGPGTSFNSLGTLNSQDVVQLTGKDSHGAWLQIEFPSGPEGKGWVNAAFVRALGLDLSGLPIITEAGLIIGTGTPTSIPSTPTATVIPAWEDNDSATSPVASVIFAPGGTQRLIYNGDLSSPEGDAQDWIAFQTYTRSIFVSLACQGNSLLDIEMIADNRLVTEEITCGGPTQEIPVRPGSNYALHLTAIPAATELQYINYELTIRIWP